MSIIGKWSHQNILDYNKISKKEGQNLALLLTNLLQICLISWDKLGRDFILKLLFL